MLNSVFLNEQAAIFAGKVSQQSGPDDSKFVAGVLQQTLQRAPTSFEIDRGVKLIADLQQEHRLSSDEARKYYCLMALNLNEFIYLD